MTNNQKPLQDDDVLSDARDFDEPGNTDDALNRAIPLDELEYDPDSVNPLDDIPAIEDEEDISGSATEPEADDDVLEYAQDMGIGTDANIEHPQELNIADDIEAAERSRRGY